MSKIISLILLLSAPLYFNAMSVEDLQKENTYLKEQLEALEVSRKQAYESEQYTEKQWRRYYNEERQKWEKHSQQLQDQLAHKTTIEDLSYYKNNFKTGLKTMSLVLLLSAPIYFYAKKKSTD